MGKLIRKRTFLGNIALVIFLAFLSTVTFGAIPASAVVTPTSNSNMDVVVNQNAPVKVLGDNGWQTPGNTAKLTTDVGAENVKFTIQVLTDSFDSVYLEIATLLGKTKVANMNPGVVSATFKAIDGSVYGVVYNVYQLVYSYTNPAGFNPDLATWIKVYAGGISTQSIDLDLEEPVPIADGNVAPPVTETPLALSSSADPTDTVTLNIPANVTEPKVNLGAVLNTPNAGDTTVTSRPLPQLNMNRPDGTVVQIPAGAKVTAPVGWTGTIQLPTIKPAAQANLPAGYTADNCVEVGFGDVELTFDKAVKIVLPGQKGKKAGYSRAGVFTEITRVIPADKNTEALVSAYLGAKEDGKQDAPAGSNDLYIWTKHFTTFVAYTPTPSSPGGGGGSGQPYVTSTTGSAKVYPSAGGSIGLGSDATVKIPANALKGSSQVEVKVQKVTSPAVAPTGYKLFSGAYDFIIGGSHSYTFDKKVTVALKFDPKLVAAGQTPAMFSCQDGTTKWTKIGGTVSGSTISAEVDHFTQFAVMAEDKAAPPPVTGGLTDIKGHWAQAVIAELVEKGVITGYPDKTFKPERTMTRTEFAVVLAKAFNLQPDASYALKFKDNSKIPAWGKAYVAAAVKAGIVKGDDRGNFNPSANVTRAEMAVMVAKATNAKLSTAPKLTFKDKVPNWAAGAVEYLVKADVLTGYPDNTFKPGNNATRAEACTVISKAGRL